MTERYLRLFMVALLMLTTGALFAQGGKATLSGTIKDSAQKPLHYATVELVRAQQPTQVLKSTYTNDKGKFGDECSRQACGLENSIGEATIQLLRTRESA